MKNIIKKGLAVMAAALMLATGLIGCGSKTDSDKAYVQDKGKLIVGVTIFEPLDYQDANGAWLGFDADMAKAFAESLGVEAEFVVIDWDSKAMELQNRSIDCVWNGMTLTDGVKTAMECSQPYCNNQQVVIVPADKAEQYKTVEACKTLRFAVEAGSAGKDMAEANGFTFTEVDDQAKALMEVKAGTADIALIDSVAAAGMVGEGTDYADLALDMSNDFGAQEYGIAFRKGSDVCAAVDAAIAELRADGTLDAIAAKYGLTSELIK